MYADIGKEMLQHAFEGCGNIGFLSLFVITSLGVYVHEIGNQSRVLASKMIQCCNPSPKNAALALKLNIFLNTFSCLTKA